VSEPRATPSTFHRRVNLRSHIVLIMESRRLRWAENVPWVGRLKINTHRVLIAERPGKRPLKKFRIRLRGLGEGGREDGKRTKLSGSCRFYLTLLKLPVFLQSQIGAVTAVAVCVLDRERTSLSTSSVDRNMINVRKVRNLRSVAAYWCRRISAGAPVNQRSFHRFTQTNSGINTISSFHILTCSV
jgi:hypothetical protein